MHCGYNKNFDYILILHTVTPHLDWNSLQDLVPESFPDPPHACLNLQASLQVAQQLQQVLVEENFDLLEQQERTISQKSQAPGQVKNPYLPLPFHLHQLAVEGLVKCATYGMRREI